MNIRHKCILSAILPTLITLFQLSNQGQFTDYLISREFQKICDRVRVILAFNYPLFNIHFELIVSIVSVRSSLSQFKPLPLPPRNFA